MGIKILDNGDTLINYSYRRKDGKATNIQRTIKGHNRIDIARAEGELIRSVEDTLTCTERFSRCVEVVVKENGGAGMQWYYNQVKTYLGGHKLDKDFIGKYHAYIDKLKDAGNAENTISHHKSAIRTALNAAYRRGIIESVPIRDWSIKMTFRDRIWTADERTRIYNAMAELNSHLYHAVAFSEKNPIRKSDLFALTRDNLVLFGPNAPYVHYTPKKTEKRKPRETYLVEITDEILSYWNSLPPNCQWLFPRYTGTQYIKQGDPKTHWNTICGPDYANVKDLVWHDLKHVAITYMLHKTDSAGNRVYSKDDLKELGIQYSDRAIDVYNRLDAVSVIERVRNIKPVSDTVSDFRRKVA